MDPAPDLASVIEEIKANPSVLSEVMEQAGRNIDPNLIKQAQKMIANGSFDDVLNNLKQQGGDTKALQKLISKQVSNVGPTQQVLFINRNRSVISKAVSKENMIKDIRAILKTVEPVEATCSRLALGPWEGKSIKVWYNPNAVGKNRLTSRVLGFTTGSEIIIVSEDDLKIKDFEVVDSQIVKTN